MSPNGKIYSQRLGTSAREQKMLAQAIKRARMMGLLPTPPPRSESVAPGRRNRPLSAARSGA